MTKTNEAPKIVGGNIKLGNMGSWSKLMGNDDYTVTINGHEYTLKGSCGGYCEGCKGACYVRKSYRYPSVIKRHALNSKAFNEDLEQAFEQLRGQLERKRKPFTIIRINQSGELESKEEFMHWCKTASMNPNTTFYVYTKAFDIIEESLELVPTNMYVLVSVWHEYGIDFYNKVKDNNRVKAFVYMDGFDYEAMDLHVETMCNAYKRDENTGKMVLNHNLTCDKCKKCFSDTYKVIGCLDH